MRILAQPLLEPRPPGAWLTGARTEQGPDRFRRTLTLREATRDAGLLLIPGTNTTANDKIVADAMADIDSELEALLAPELVAAA